MKKTREELIEEIRRIEDKRLEDFPNYYQKHFKIKEHFVFVKLERPAKKTEQDVNRKRAMILYDLREKSRTLFGCSVRSYAKSLYDLTDGGIRFEEQSELYNSKFEEFRNAR